MFIWLQYKAKTFTEFVPNYKKSNNKPQNNNSQNLNNITQNNCNQNLSQINNNQQIINNYVIEIKDLKRQLKEEKDKNLKLINENNILKNTIDNLNKKLEQIKGIKQSLENDLAQKDIEIQKLRSQKSNDYFDISSLEPNDKIIGVNFVSMGINDIGHYNLVCKTRDLFVKLEERLYNDFPQFKNYETYFEVNGKRIKRFQTLEQNKIKNNDIISMFIIDE